jgi:hypothetical protein
MPDEPEKTQLDKFKEVARQLTTDDDRSASRGWASW